MTTMIDKIANAVTPKEINLTPKDFKSPVDVRWCPGCGDYSILGQVQKTLPTLGLPKEKFVFVSGIGCSSRFPYYMPTYGMHTLHGRAIPIATGLKIARPDLSVWVITGDGDGLSIGGNHFIHGARRNIDLNVLLFNNAIYSLTKGQYSPTSLEGQKTKSSPLGVLDYPFNPPEVAIGAGATFVARAYDKDPAQLQRIIKRAHEHKGFSFVEIYTNCVIFNDHAYDKYTRKDMRMEHSVELRHGEPLIFGKNRDKGIMLDGFKPVVVNLDDGKHSVDDLLVHDETDPALAFILSNMTYNPSLPRPVGVFLAISKPTYDYKVEYQIEEHKNDPGAYDLNSLLKGSEYWEVK